MRRSSSSSLAGHFNDFQLFTSPLINNNNLLKHLALIGKRDKQDTSRVQKYSAKVLYNTVLSGVQGTRKREEIDNVALHEYSADECCDHADADDA